MELHHVKYTVPLFCRDKDAMYGLNVKYINVCDCAGLFWIQTDTMKILQKL